MAERPQDGSAVNELYWARFYAVQTMLENLTGPALYLHGYEISLASLYRRLMGYE